MKTCIKCGSHAFNLYAEEIDQGGLCDVHYWQGRAHRAEVQPVQEPVATMKMLHTYGDTTPPQRPWVGLTKDEKLELYRQFEDCLESDDWEYEKAIEAALRSKNHD